MKVEVLLQCAQEQLNYYEQQMIKAWDTLAPNGLNCTTGGEAGKRLSMETKIKISEHHKQAIFDGRMVMPDWSGREQTEATKQKISTKLKGRSQPLSEEQKMKKKQEAQGCVGIHKASGKYQAIIPKSWNNGKQKCIGLFETEEEAWAAIAEYKAEHVDS